MTTPAQILFAAGPGMLVMCFLWGMVIAADTPDTWGDVMPWMDSEKAKEMGWSLRASGIPGPWAMHYFAPLSVLVTMIALWRTRRRTI